MAKTPLTSITIGPGELQWVNIAGEGVANMSGTMQYKAQIALAQDNPEYTRCAALINDYWAENKPKGFKRKPKSTGMSFCDPLLDSEGNQQEDEEGKKMYDPKGRVAFVFKTSTTWPDGNTKVVKTYNSKNAEVHLGTRKIGNGSVGSIQGKIGLYASENPTNGQVIDAGVTLYLDKIQLRKFEEFAGDAVTFDTDEAEGGFVGFEEDNFEGTEDGHEEAKPSTKARL